MSQQDFDTAAENVKKLKTQPGNDDLLMLYSLYKQATVGDVNTTRPGMLALKEKAKWDAWEKQKGTSKEDAQKKYVTKANELIASIGIQ